MNCEDIRKRFDALKSQRTTAEQTWDHIERFIAPYRGRFFRDTTDEHSIDWLYEKIYDATALEANKLLAANIHGNVTSPVLQWFMLRFREQELNDDAEAKDWLETVGAQIYMSLHENGFNLHIAEAYLDLTTYGNCFVFEEMVDGNLQFQTIPLIEGFFEADSKNQLYRFYRRLRWTPIQIIDKFGEDGVTPDILARAENPNSATDKMEVVFCIYPRDVPESEPNEVLAPNRRPYGCKYLLHATAEQLGDESGYYEMPVYIGRWETTSDSVWGHGPSHIALPTVKSLNEMLRLALRSWAKDIDPPILTTERGLVGDLDLEPGGLTVLRSLEEIRPLLSGANYNAAQMGIEDFRRQVREIYFVNRLDLKESPAMTATEVNARLQQMQKLIGPVLGRLQSDLLQPLIERTFNLLLREGRLPDMPETLAGANLDIEFIGSIPMAQRMDQVTAVQDFAQFVAGLAQINPDALDRLDIDGAIKDYHDARGVPASAIKSDGEVEALRQQRQQKMAQAEQMAMLQEGATALKDGGAGIAKLAEVQR